MPCLYAASVNSALVAGPAVAVIWLGLVAQDQLDRGHVLIGKYPEVYTYCTNTIL